MDRWHVLFVFGAMVVGCGGNVKADAHNGNSNRGGATGGGASASGGAAAGGTEGIPIIPTAGFESGGAQSGGESSETGGAGGDDGDDCNEFLLWFMVADAVLGGLGTCSPSKCIPGSPPRGTVTFDGEGHAIGLTGTDPAYVEEWLEDVASERWVCLAGQSVDFCCSSL